MVTFHPDHEFSTWGTGDMSQRGRDLNVVADAAIRVAGFQPTWQRLPEPVGTAVTV